MDSERLHQGSLDGYAPSESAQENAGAGTRIG